MKARSGVGENELDEVRNSAVEEIESFSEERNIVEENKLNKGISESWNSAVEEIESFSEERNIVERDESASSPSLSASAGTDEEKEDPTEGVRNKMNGNQKPKVAVVILNWNGAPMLRQFLPSVCRCSLAEGVSVVVADNASTDESCQVVGDEFPQVRLIRLDRNYGFAEGYDRALAQVEAEYYVLLNSDVEVTEGWLQPMVCYLDAHPEVAACQPKLLSWKQRQMFEYAGAAGGFIDALGYPYCRGRIFGTVEEDHGQYDHALPVFWATGAALCVRAADFHAVGGLDAQFFAHMEEIDFCWRLHLAGRQVVCIPSAKVYHVGGATLRRENPRKTYLNFRNNLLMLYKNLPAGRLWTVLTLRFFLDYLAAFTYLIKGDLSNVKAVCQARLDFWRLSAYRRKARHDVWSRLVCGASTSSSSTADSASPASSSAVCGESAETSDRPSSSGEAVASAPKSKAVVPTAIPEIRPASILWAYHVLGKKKYSNLYKCK